MSKNEIYNAFKRGKTVVYPTDTAYGIGVDATNLKAVNRLYKIKGRKLQPTHIVVSSMKMAKKYVEFSDLAERIFKKFLPGPLTLVLPLKKQVPLAVKKLSAKTGTLGIRMPRNKVALDIVKKLKRPITTPSANPRNGKIPYSVFDSYIQFENRKYKPDLYLDEGDLPTVKASTMLKIDGEKVKVLRRGPITKKQILKTI